MEPRPISPEVTTNTGRFLVQVERSLRAGGVDTSIPQEAVDRLSQQDFWLGQTGLWTKMSSQYTLAERVQEMVCKGVLEETQRLGETHPDVTALRNNLGIGDRKLDLPALISATSGSLGPAQPHRTETRQDKSPTIWLVDEISEALKRRGTNNPNQVKQALSDEKFWLGTSDSFWDSLATEAETGQTAEEYQEAKCREILHDIRYRRDAHNDRANLRVLFALPQDYRFDLYDLIDLTNGFETHSQLLEREKQEREFDMESLKGHGWVRIRGSLEPLPPEKPKLKQKENEN